MSYVAILITYIFISNFILVQFLGMCPFIGVSKNSESALGMGMAVTFVTSVASVVTWAIYAFLLVPFNLTYLRTVAFILVIAALVQVVELVVRKISPPLYKALGIYLPLITTNCAVLGIAIINIDESILVYNPFLEDLLQDLVLRLQLY
jgi:electron transport complex protein RnfA